MISKPQFIPKNPEYLKNVQRMIEVNRFMHHVGLKINVIQPGLIEGKLQINDIHRQQNNFLHGGVATTFCDVVAGFAAFTLVAENEHVVTAEIKVSYLNPGVGDEAIAIGKVLKNGKRFIFCESELFVGDRLCAKATTTMAIIEKR